MFDGYVKARESLYTWVIIWDNNILDHIDNRVTLPRYKILAWYIDLKGIENKNTAKHLYRTSIKSGKSSS